MAYPNLHEKLHTSATDNPSQRVQPNFMCKEGSQPAPPRPGPRVPGETPNFILLSHDDTFTSHLLHEVLGEGRACGVLLVLPERHRRARAGLLLPRQDVLRVQSAAAVQLVSYLVVLWWRGKGVSTAEGGRARQGYIHDMRVSPAGVVGWVRFHFSRPPARKQQYNSLRRYIEARTSLPGQQSIL